LGRTNTKNKDLFLELQGVVIKNVWVKVKEGLVKNPIFYYELKFASV